MLAQRLVGGIELRQEQPDAAVVAVPSRVEALVEEPSAELERRLRVGEAPDLHEPEQSRLDLLEVDHRLLGARAAGDHEDRGASRRLEQAVEEPLDVRGPLRHPYARGDEVGVGEMLPVAEQRLEQGTAPLRLRIGR